MSHEIYDLGVSKPLDTTSLIAFCCFWSFFIFVNVFQKIIFEYNLFIGDVVVFCRQAAEVLILF